MENVLQDINFCIPRIKARHFSICLELTQSFQERVLVDLSMLFTLQIHPNMVVRVKFEMFESLSGFV